MKQGAESNLSEDVMNWVIEAVDTHAIVQSHARLKGSTSSTLHRISLQKNKVICHFVIRQFDNKAWLDEEPDLAWHEAESLRLAAKIGVQTPEIIAFDETGDECGVPIVLMTRLDGSVELKPSNMKKWLNGLAKVLMDIHKVNADNFDWEYFTYNKVSTLKVPSWSSASKSWEKAIEIVQGTQPKFKSCFIHRDYHPTNVLWENGAISGIVDWVNACRGPAGIDVGHCRLNLAMLYDVPTADAFLTAYEQYKSDTFTYHPYWDFLSLIDILDGPLTVYPGWAAFGVTGLTDKMMEQRLDKYIESLIKRLEK